MNYLIKPKTLAEKLLLLRSRIEDWCEINGYDNMGNQAIRKDTEGGIVWKRSDWEYIDDCYGLVLNKHTNHWTIDQFKNFNKMWHRYKIDVSIKNANLEPDWEQLQQMDWNDIGDEVSLGPDPTMGVKV